MNLNEGFRLIGSSKRMREVQEDLEKVAHTDYSVLLVGETGSGKEVAARHLHRKSRRSHMSFLGFNCSNLTDETAGSQLFGHERGSFTDAYTTKIGIFERIDSMGSIHIRYENGFRYVKREYFDDVYEVVRDEAAE